MTQVIWYNASIPAVATDQVHIEIPLTPEKVILAELGVFIAPHFANNRVQLVATVGVGGEEASISQLLFRLFRGTQEIYYALQGVEPGYERNMIITFQAVDTNVSVGAHGYSLYVERLTESGAAVIGPINLSATAFAW